ncbi:MAG: carboxypeptidase regulatory-like domain-containing protein [Muribaculaceae bacterium]|nr:carboxypeptidase regulatory-like domain-containing protein [Muribaculaceae bacterium]
MKKSLLFLILFVMALGADAQTQLITTTGTIRGVVVDKYGNPLPGAQVSATNGAETTYVESDGSFTLEIPRFLESVTASYAGLPSKKLRPDFENNMMFKLLPPDRHVFLNLAVGSSFDTYESENYINIGAMVGVLSDWGYYGKVMFPINSDYYYDWYLGIQLTGGVIKRIYKWFYAYLGIGYGPESESEYGSYGAGFVPGIQFEGGFIFNIKEHFNVTLGSSVSTMEFIEPICTPTLSFGYVF